MEKDKCHKDDMEEFIKAIKRTFPEIFPRTAVTDLSCGVLNARTLSNRMSLGTGPRGIRVGRKICITRENLVEWLQSEVGIKRA